MSRAVSRFVVAVTAAVLATGGMSLQAPGPARAVSPNVVISQVYGGGGNSGATLTHDFIELFNRGTAAQSLAGWSVQYASATGSGSFGSTSSQLTELPAVTLAPGQYLLIQEAQGAAGTTALPTPDVIDAIPISMSGTSGKVALVSSTVSLGCNGGSIPCDAAALAQIVDLIGYGAANFFEGSAGPALSNTTAALRANGGCTDTDDNAVDFAAAEPAPRNTATALHVCPTAPTLSIDDVTAQEGDAGTTTFEFTVSLSSPAGAGGVTFDIETADDTATVADNDYVATAFTGQTIPAGASTYGFSVAVNGDTVVEPNETFLVNVSNPSGATISDGQGIGTIVDEDVCGEPYTPVYDIQGDGLSAAIIGAVTTQGVVVGDLEGPTSSGIQGFYVQDATGDADPTTSDGIFVFTGNADNGLSVGDVVRVTGYARERFSQTTINGSNSNSSAVTDIVLCGSGSVTPADVTMPFESTTYLERYEGMLVRFPQALVISEYFNYDRFGELVLGLPLDGESRHFTPTNVEEPGDPAIDRAAEYALRRITLDDGLGVQNPSFTRHPNGNAFALDNRFRGGDTVTNTVGVLGFDFSLYRIQPTGPADYASANPRPAAPEDVGGRLTVASMNTLNYFLTLDLGPDVCGPAEDVECRGADNATEFDRQRAKLLAALEGLDADIVGLNELENTTGVEPLADIVAGLNSDLGPGTYAYIETGTIGTDAIKVGFIYKPGSVTPIGDHEILDSTDDPRFDDTRSRPALAQSFEENGTGARFTVVVNHLKSKGSACDGDPDLGDGQGNCNVTRTLAAEALVDWLATDPTSSGDPDFLIIGDLNSYAMEDPIDAVKDGPDDATATADDYTNLIAQFQGLHAYSYVFDGQAGYLDHALANASLASQVTGAVDWHINADEPDILDYDTSFKSNAQDAIYAPDAYRSSDHDPLLVGLDLDAPPTIEVVAGGTCAPNGGTFLATVGDLHTPAGDLILSLTGNTNPTLVPNGTVVIGGAGANRTISMTVAAGQTGVAALTFTLDDGVYTTDYVITVIVGTMGSDVLVGTSGSDLVLGGSGADSIFGGDGGDLLCGGNGADSIFGGDGADTLEGARGDDILSGGDGDDVLRGGRGADTMTGGDGGDAFFGGLGADTTTDFDAGEGDSGS